MLEKTKKLLESLSEETFFAQNKFTLLGGTALSYHCKHRLSEDLDFATNDELPQDALFLLVRKYGGISLPANQAAYTDFMIAGDDIRRHSQAYIFSDVKVEFFTYPKNILEDEILKNDSPTRIGNISIASIDTLFKTKALLLLDRQKSRDLYDVLWLIKHKHYTIHQMIEVILRYRILYNEELILRKIEAMRPHDADEGLFGLLEENTPTLNELRDALLTLFYRHQQTMFLKIGDTIHKQRMIIDDTTIEIKKDN